MALQSILSPNRRESLPTPSAGGRMRARLEARAEILILREVERPRELLFQARWFWRRASTARI